jgi:hypothetical protein
MCLNSDNEDNEDDDEEQEAEDDIWMRLWNNRLLRVDEWDLQVRREEEDIDLQVAREEEIEANQQQEVAKEEDPVTIDGYYNISI